jgi:hypothetical protein
MAMDIPCIFIAHMKRAKGEDGGARNGPRERGRERREIKKADRERVCPDENTTLPVLFPGLLTR